MTDYTHRIRIGRWTVRDPAALAVRTPTTGTLLLSADQLSLLELRAAIGVLTSVGQVGGPELKCARKALGMRREQLARYLGVSRSAVLRWEEETEPLERPVQLAVLNLLEELSRERGLRGRRFPQEPLV